MRTARERGFVSIDALAGLMLLAVVAVVMSIYVSQRYRAAMHLADSREAARLAEAALIDGRQSANPPRATRDNAAHHLACGRRFIASVGRDESGCQRPNGFADRRDTEAAVKHSPSIRRTHGMFLLEVLVVLVLTSAFLLLATRLFKDIFTQLRQTPLAEMKLDATHGILRTLHDDTWQATAIKVVSSQSVELSYRDGRTVSWSVDEEGSVSRKDSKQPTADVSRELVIGLQFSSETGALIVHWPADKTVTYIRLVSQMLLANTEAK